MTARHPQTYKEFRGIHAHVETGSLEYLRTAPNLQDNINEKQQGYTPLYLAIFRRYNYIVPFLLNAGADPNIVCRGLTPLHLAVLRSEGEIVEELFRFGADPSIICRTVSPMHIASARGMVDIVQLLLMNGCSVNHNSSKHGTPLHVCCIKNHKYIARFLIEVGHCDVNLKNEEGETALHMVSRSGYADIVELLLEREDLDASVQEPLDGNSALHLAILSNKTKIFKMIAAKFPAVIDIKNTIEDKTALFYATRELRRMARSQYLKDEVGFEVLVNKMDFSDLKVLCQDGKELNAHCILLWGRWPKFRDIISKLEAPYVLDLSEHRLSIVKTLLRYLYADKFVCNHKYLEDMVKLAKWAELDRLEALSERAISVIRVDRVPASTYASEMQALINESKFSDATITIGNRSISAHRIILQARSDYFKAMFCGASLLKESTDGNISFPDISFEGFRRVLKYLYSSNLKGEIIASTAQEVFELSSRFMIENLRRRSEMFLLGHLCVENAVLLFALADAFKSLFLREDSFDFILRNYYHVLKDSHWETLDPALQKEVKDYRNRYKDVERSRRAAKLKKKAVQVN